MVPAQQIPYAWTAEFVRYGIWDNYALPVPLVQIYRREYCNPMDPKLSVATTRS